MPLVQPLEMVVLGFLALNTFQNCLVFMRHSQKVSLSPCPIQAAFCVRFTGGLKTRLPLYYMCHLLNQETIVSLYDGLSLFFHLFLLCLHVEVEVRFWRLIVNDGLSRYNLLPVGVESQFIPFLLQQFVIGWSYRLIRPMHGTVMLLYKNIILAFFSDYFLIYRDSANAYWQIVPLHLIGWPLPIKLHLRYCA